MKRHDAKIYRKMIEQASKSLSDDDAFYTPELFPRWRAGLVVILNERLCWQNKLYKCVQPHTTQDGWEPDQAPALWTEVPKPGEIPVWRQPTGAQDAYMNGDKVHYPTIEDPVYISTVDNNVWEPGVYGWNLV